MRIGTGARLCEDLLGDDSRADRHAGGVGFPVVAVGVATCRMDVHPLRREDRR